MELTGRTASTGIHVDRDSHAPVQRRVGRRAARILKLLDRVSL